MKGFRVFMGSNVAGHELAISLEALVSSVSHQLSARAMSNQGMGFWEMAPSNRGGFRMGSVVMGGGLMDLLIRPVKCPGRPCLIGGGILIRK